MYLSNVLKKNKRTVRDYLHKRNRIKKTSNICSTNNKIPNIIMLKSLFERDR